MRLSKIFFKTNKKSKSSLGSVEKFLRNGCFIQKYRNGRYYFLPLGMIVFHNVTRLLGEYMWKIGAQETMLPLFHSNNLWEESRRNYLGDFFVTNLIDRGGSRYNLAASPEEMYLNLIRNYNIARNDLPVNFFQFGKKFRNEYHTRGLLRLKEFTMMDSYSFHADESSFQKEYKKISDIFIKFFDDLTLKVFKIRSDGGFAGGLSAYEFVLNSKHGESKYVTTKNHQYLAHIDVAVFKKENINLDEKMLPVKKIEIPDSVRTIADYARYFSVGPKLFTIFYNVNFIFHSFSFWVGQ
ncbi:MAG: aminoacyl--tRNA ligase-related protein [Candidatus Shapirobacteria bacterium]